MNIRNFKKVINKYSQPITVIRKGIRYTDQNTGREIKEADTVFEIRAHYQPLTSTTYSKGNAILQLDADTNKIQGGQWVFTYDELKVNDILIIEDVEYLIKKADAWHGHWESFALRKEYQNV